MNIIDISRIYESFPAVQILSAGYQSYECLDHAIRLFRSTLIALQFALAQRHVHIKLTEFLRTNNKIHTTIHPNRNISWWIAGTNTHTDDDVDLMLTHLRFQ